MHCGIGKEGRHAKLTFAIDEGAEVRKMVIVPIRNSLEAIKRDTPCSSHPRNSGRLHVRQHRLISFGETALLISARHVVQRNKPIAARVICDKMLTSAGVDNLRHGTGGSRLDGAGKCARPSIGDKRLRIGLSKDPLHSASGGGAPYASSDSHGIALANATRPQIPLAPLPVSYKRLQFPGKRSDNGDFSHAGGAYPCAQNQSIAERKAS